ncbi:MAG: hypothetical protein DYH12_36160, partial [Sorangiineae bacterium PRO1]|nr:hypothetical protein [Sorangiineae bacterium PRO1]
APVSHPAASARGRLTLIDGVRYRDSWLERDVYVLQLASAAAERARAFARADHRALASVLCVQPDKSAVWVEVVSGERVTLLDPQERRELGDALAALHRAGSAHGAVDSSHVIRRGGETLLGFPLSPAHGSAEADFEALDALARSTLPAG